MLTILLCFTVYAPSFLHAKPLTDHPAPRTFPVRTTDTKHTKKPTFDLPTTVPRGCEYEGKIYEPYESFGEGNDGEGWCYGLYCDEDGNVIPWDNFNCVSTTTPSTTPPKPTTLFTTFSGKPSTIPKPTTNAYTTVPRSLGCEYEGKFYAPGESFGEGTDGEGWCYGLYCDDDGNAIPWDDFNCGSTTTPSTAPPRITTFFTTFSRKPSTTPKPTTNAYTTVPRSLGCEYEGKFYAPGESFGEGTDGEGWCYGLYCDDDGNAIPWDDFNCGSATTPSTTPPRPTTLFTTFSRKPSTTRKPKTNPSPPKTASPPTTPEETTSSSHTRNAYTTIPRRLGCEYEGKFYAPGESFGEGTDGEGWCYGYYCDHDGNKISWDKFNCGTNTALPTSTFPAMKKLNTTTRNSTPRGTARLTTFSPPATTVPFTPIGCMHEGKFYPPGEITQRKEGNWCHGLICDQFGEIIAWDNWNCKSTTYSIPTTFPRSSTPKTASPTTTTTTHPTTTPRTSTAPPNESPGPTSSLKSPAPRSTLHSTTPPSIGWCFFNGRYFENGDIISRVYHAWSWCSGWYCNDGKVDSWSDFDCPNPTTLPMSKPSTLTPQCYYEGVYYNHGEVVFSGVGSGDCEGLYCSDGVLVQYEDRDCGSAIQTDTTTTVAELPTTKPNPTNTKFDLFATKTDAPIVIASKSFHSTMATSPTTQSAATTKLLEPVLCFYEGKYYEEGDIVSRNFDGDNWCSGWYCKGGRLISVDCNDIINSLSENNTSTPKSTIPTNTQGPELPRCFHDERYYEEGDLVTSGNNWCTGLICKDGVMVLWDDCEVKVKSTDPTITDTAGKTATDLFQTQGITSTNLPTSDLTLTQSTPTSISTTKASEPQLCFHEGKYFEEGDVISQDFDGDNWCSGWICRGGQLISANCSDITSLISKDGTVSPTTVFPTATREPEPLQCLHDGRLYKDGDLATSGENWCSGLICKNGKMLMWDNCKVKPDSTSQPITDSTLGQSTTSVSETNTTSDKKDVTKTSEPPLCFHEGKYYEEGDIVSRDFDGDDWCSGFICRDGRLILVNCNDITSSISKNDASSPSPFPPATLGPEPPRCYHEGRYYEEGDLATSDNNWCTGFICKDGAMILWDNCELKVDSTSRPITDIGKTDSELSETTTHASVNDSTTQSTTTSTSPTKITSQIEGTSKPPEPDLCYHDGKYYEEGDIISRNFDGENWCSGWYCKNGRLTPVDCSDLTSSLMKEDTLSPKPTLPPATPGPEPAQCFHEGRYYEEGDLATSDNNWCTGLLCKDGVMVLWDDCEVMPKSTKSSKVTQIPVKTVAPKSTPTPPQVTTSAQSTLKPRKTTPKIFESSAETPVTVTASYETTEASSKNPYTTKKISYTTHTTPEVITKSQVTTAKVPISTSSIPHITTEIPDNTARFPDSTTMTTNIPTRPEQTTPTQPPQTTKPESQKCLYEGKLYPPGEITNGVLADGRCYGVICDISGVVTGWATAYCTPTEPPTADIKTSLPGCVYNGKYYPPGRISRISNDINKWCLDVMCTDEGKIVTDNNVGCDKPTTTEPTKTTITCLYNGMKYSPGIIKEGADEGGWCYKVVCQDDGQLYLWGDWHCRFTRRPTTTAPPETAPTTPTTCIYNEREYPVGEITRGSDASGWCYGVTCKNNGEIVLWGSFGCRKA